MVILLRKLLVAAVWIGADALSDSDTCLSDHDDTVLLQTVSKTTKVEKDISQTAPKMTKVRADRVLHIHRFGIDVKEDTISLLENPPSVTGTVYSLCATDGGGNHGEVADEFGALVESCGNFDVFNERGEDLGTINGCSPGPIPKGQCVLFVESNGNDGIERTGTPHQLVHVPVVAWTDQSALLIQIPKIDKNDKVLLQKVIEQIREKKQEFQGSPMLLQTAFFHDVMNAAGGFMNENVFIPTGEAISTGLDAGHSTGAAIVNGFSMTGFQWFSFAVNEAPNGWGIPLLQNLW